MTRLVPVEQLEEGDVLVLPSGRRVEVESVEHYDAGYIVRWGSGPYRGEGNMATAPLRARDGRRDELGSTAPVPAGHLWRIE